MNIVLLLQSKKNLLLEDKACLPIPESFDFIFTFNNWGLINQDPLILNLKIMKMLFRFEIVKVSNKNYLSLLIKKSKMLLSIII